MQYWVFGTDASIKSFALQKLEEQGGKMPADELADAIHDRFGFWPGDIYNQHQYEFHGVAKLPCFVLKVEDEMVFHES